MDENVKRLVEVTTKARDEMAEDDEFDNTQMLGQLNEALAPFNIGPKWQDDKQQERHEQLSAAYQRMFGTPYL